MVLTNFELWAADGSAGSNLPLDFETNNPHTRHLNPFDPRVVPQINSSSSTNLNHLSSNGYYGFSYINAAHNIELNNNNNNINNNNNNTSNINHNNYNNNNNNTTTYNFMANDVNGMNNTFTPTSLNNSNNNNNNINNFGSSAYAAGNAVNVTRCKKRFFVMHDDDNDVNLAANADCTSTNNNNKNYYNNNYEVSAKRCRFDDDFSAQYCNDFFQLPSTQIATQSCLMDTEEVFEKNNNNIEKYEHNLDPQLQNQLTAQQHHHHHNHQQMQSHNEQQHQQPQQQQQHLYHQQQHYQDIQFANNKCHFNHNNNNNNSSDTLTLNNNYQTYNKIDFEKEYLKNNNNNENVLIKKHKLLKTTNNNDDKDNNNDDDDNDVANDFKVDDATLFAHLHGGCLHHHDHNNRNFKSTTTFASCLNNGIYTIEKDVTMNHHNVLQDENYYEEF